jgi:hypothetical protein
MHRFTILTVAGGDPITRTLSPDEAKIGWACSRCGMVRWVLVGEDLPMTQEDCFPSIKYRVDVEMDGEQFYDGGDDDGERQGQPVEEVVEERTSPEWATLRKVG